MTPPVLPLPTVAGPPHFTDVPSNHSYYLWIQKLWEIGITSGETVSPPTFGPDDPLTRAEAAVFIIACLEVAGLLPPAPPAIMTPPVIK